MRGVEMGRGISTINRGPSIGSIGRIGMPRPERGFSVSRIANPFNPQVGEFRLASPKTEIRGGGVRVLRERVRPQFSAASVIAEAERIVALAKKPGVQEAAKRPAIIERKVTDRRGNLIRTPESAIVRLPNPDRGLDIRVLSKPIQASKVHPEAQIRIQPKTESNPGYRVRRIVSSSPASRVQTEQVKEERLKIEQKQEEKAGKRQSEKRSVAKIKFSEAVEISKKRAAALKRAFQEIKTRGLSIKFLRVFLSRTYWEAISPIAQKGHDGTLNLTVSELEKHKSEDYGEAKTDQAIAYAVSNHIPVQKGEGGRLVTIEEVREVLEGIEKQVLKLNTPAEMVIRRVVSKNVELIKAGQIVAVSEEKEEALEETTLKSLGLEEVYPNILPKAA